MKRMPTKVAVALVAMVLALGLTVTPALAFLGVADTGDGVLAAILTNAVSALKTAQDTWEETKEARSIGSKAYDTVKDSYALASHSAELVDNAVVLGHSMRQFSASRFGTAFTQDLEVAFPDVAYWRREAAHPLGLGGPYNPGLSNALKYCLADAITYKDACQRLKGKTEADRTLAMVDLTFGIKASSERPAPTTQAEMAQQTCDDSFRTAMVQVEAERKLMAQTAGKLTELREKCEKSLTALSPGKRTYGVFQTIADDAGRVSGDVDWFSDAKTAQRAQAAAGASPQVAQAQAAAAQAKGQSEACTALKDQEEMIAAETAKYSRTTDLALKSLELCKMGQARAEEEEAKRSAAAEAAAAHGNRVARQRKLNTSGGVVVTMPTAGNGYNILDDARGKQ